MKRYELKVVDYKGNDKEFYFASRKQAYVFITSNMLMSNKYRTALLVDNTTGECWLDICWRGQDNYKGRTRGWYPFFFFCCCYNTHTHTHTHTHVCVYFPKYNASWAERNKTVR